MKSIIILLISIFVTIFFVIIFIIFRNANLGNEAKLVINKIFISRGRYKNLNKQFDFYFNNFGAFKFLNINIDSLEKLYLLKVSISFLSFISFNFLGIYLNRNFILPSLLVAFILYILPTEILKGKIIRIRDNVYTDLPDFIDVLYSLVSAGLTFDESIKYFIENNTGEIESLFEIYKMKQMEGNSKKEALEFIGELSFCDEFKRVVGILAQSEIVGNPIKEILMGLSTEIRSSQRDQVKIKAEKLENNLIFIIFIFIFIPMILIFLLPILPQIKSLF